MTEEELIIKAELLKDVIEKEIIRILELSYKKPYNLDSRIKSLDKIEKKIEFRKNNNVPYSICDIGDVVGFRISVESEEDVVFLQELFLNIWVEEPSCLFDFFNEPKSNGFKAFILQFKQGEIPYEIQFMTNEMREWVNLTHEEHDNLKYGKM